MFKDFIQCFVDKVYKKKEAHKKAKQLAVELTEETEGKNLQSV